MKIASKIAIIAALGLGLLMAGPAASMASTAPTASRAVQVHQPQAVAGYLFAGHIQINGEFLCLTALKPHVGSELSFHACLPHDRDQEWDAIAVTFKVGPAVLHLELSGPKGTAQHPALCLGGIAGSHETLKLINCNHDVPLPESLFLSGSLTKQYAVNRISNQIRRYVGAPPYGRTPFWTGRFFPRNFNRGWVFGMAFFGEGGWVQENQV